MCGEREEEGGGKRGRDSPRQSLKVPISSLSNNLHKNRHIKQSKSIQAKERERGVVGMCVCFGGWGVMRQGTQFS